MNRKIYASFAISYLLVFLIPIALNFITQNRLMTILQQNVGESRMHNLEQCRDAMDNQFQVLDNMLANLSVNNNLRSIAIQDSPNVNHATVPSFIRGGDILTDSDVVTGFADVFLYLNKPDIYLSASRNFLNSSYFYGTYFTYGGMSRESWDSLLTDQSRVSRPQPSLSVKMGQTESERILILQSFPAITGGLGKYIILVDANALTSMLGDSMASDGLFSIVSDENGVILARTGIEEEWVDADALKIQTNQSIRSVEIGGEPMQLIQCKSKYNGLVYTTVVPLSAIASQLDSVRGELLFATIIAIAVGMISITVIVLFNGKPISDTMGLIHQYMAPEGRRSSNIRHISSSVGKIIENNRQLAHNIEVQKPQMKMLLIEQLMEGSFSGAKTDEAILQALEALDIKPIRGPMRVVLFLLDSPDEGSPAASVEELVVIKQIVRQEIIASFHNENYFYDISFDRSAMIVEEKFYRGEQALKAILGDLSDSIRKRYNLPVVFCIGGISESYCKVFKSYDDAVEVSECRPMLSDKSVWSSQDAYNADKYLYPVNVEERLLTAIKSGDVALVEEQLRQVYNDNIKNRDLSPIMMQYLINELLCTLFKVVSEEDISGHLLKATHEIEQSPGFLEKFQIVTRLYRDVTSEICGKKQRRQSKVIDSIIEYIDINYANPALSLTMVADQFNFTGAYFSQMFKSEYGEKFSSYLEGVRIKKASALLMEGKTLEYISEQVGYNSVHVLRNAFKRSTGMNPNQYRTAMAQEQQ